MPLSSELEKQLKAAARTGKYIVGRKEVLASLKGSKLLVWSASANIPQELLNECRSLQIPALRFDGDPIALGKACGIPFKVSVIAVRSAGDADLKAFLTSEDYAIPRAGLLTTMPAQVETVTPPRPAKEPNEAKEPKKAKSTEAVEKEEAPKKKAKTPKSSGDKKSKAKKKEA